jgi:pimeloyl-ACP methyl ester carboxylesterase
MLTEQTFDANGVTVNYAVGEVSGPPLLLLHGVTERWQTFSLLMPHLTGKWQVYTLDLRGHGKSGRVAKSYRIVDYAQDIICFTESQISQPTVILGHSIGALVAIYVAAHQPKLVKSIILVDPPLHLQRIPLKDIPNGPYESFRQIVEIIRTNRSPQAIEQSLVQLFPEGKPEAHRARAEVLSQLDPDTLTTLLENQILAGLDLDMLLMQVKCSTLLIQGDPELGAALFNEDVNRALALLRHGERVSISEGGHMLHHSHPDAIANVINDFCSQRM